MTGSPAHDAQLQQQLQQHVQLSTELHHQYQTSLPQPSAPPPSTSSSPWRTLSELNELPPDDMDDGSLPHPGVMATPFQQLVGSFGAGGTVHAGGEVDDETVVSLDEPFHRAADVQTPVHQTRSTHLLYAPQRLNAPA